MGDNLFLGHNRSSVESFRGMNPINFVRGGLALNLKDDSCWIIAIWRTVAEVLITGTIDECHGKAASVSLVSVQVDLIWI